MVITLRNIAVPNDHGNDSFIAKSKHAGGSLRQLSAKIFVGNTMADNDAVAVKIMPAAAYAGETVNFDIMLEAQGPMHDSEIEITVPDGITGLQTGTADRSELRQQVVRFGQRRGG